MEKQVIYLTNPTARRNVAQLAATAPDDRIRRFKALAQDGLVGKEIARLIGVSTSTISDWSRKYAVAVTDGRKPAKMALTQDALKALLTYSAESGEFKRASDPSGAPLGWVKKNGYVYLSVQGKEYTAHRLAWFYVFGVWPRNQIDHINGSRTDNRIGNLRDVPNRINSHNRNDRPKSSSGLRGVSYDSRRGIYRARIMVDGVEKWLGYFESPEQAHAKYLDAKRRLHEGYMA